MSRLRIRQSLLLLLLCWQAIPGYSQEDYFQQRVTMDISAQLYDEIHQLHGHWSMTYENQSPDTLTFIYMHLWPNAYQNRSTAYAQQELSSGNTEFYFAPDTDLGFIDSLAFTARDEALKVEATDYGPDVVRLWLNEPLAPGESLRINSPFRLQFPASFSRLGHVGQSYQATQWYPKPAVYDREGWHPMSYLDYGEYYSEIMFSVEVYLTVPENYVVAATGELQTESEVKWLTEKAASDGNKRWSATDPAVYEEAAFPPSAANYKQLHYDAYWVHDFAWFADKRFHVLKDTVILNRNRDTVDVWSFFTDQQADLWQNSIKYLKRSTRFYSDHVGPYAYPQVSAVQSALSAGGGMEYPMITVIGLEPSARSLDLVLAHEVGHNWFYGILASNERDHAWMDEGFNSYYEHRYEQAYYEEADLFTKWFRGGASIGLDEIGYRYYGNQRLGQAPDTPAEQLRFYNYWVGAYSTPSLALQQLEGHWGTEKLDKVIWNYYRDWQFRHPRPEDVQESMERHGKENLDWFFQGFMASTEQQDYAIRRVRTGENVAVEIENRGSVSGPYVLEAITKGGDTIRRWYPAPVDKESWQLGLPKQRYRRISIDPDHQTLESRRQNNHWHAGWGRSEPPRLRFITGLKNEQYSDIFIAPMLAYNEHDGTLLGTVLTNRGILARPIEWYAAPLYGFEAKELAGAAGLRARIWGSATNEGLREVSLFGHLSSFHFQTFADANLPLRYLRRELGGSVKFHAAANGWEPSLRVRQLNTSVDDLQFSPDGIFEGTTDVRQNIYDARFELRQSWVLSPMRWSATLEYADYIDDFSRDQDHLKLMIEGRGKMLYQEDRAFHWRIFAGFFLSNSIDNTTYTPAQAFSLFDRGAEDYRFDNLYFDRTAIDGGRSRQLGLRAGGFRAPVPASFGLGRSNQRMISINTSIDLPFTPEWLPLKPFVDAASFAAPTFDGDQNKFLWNGGLALEWLDGRLGIYLPLVGSNEILDRLKEQGGVGQRIGVRLLLNELAPWKWIDELRSW